MVQPNRNTISLRLEKKKITLMQEVASLPYVEIHQKYLKQKCLERRIK